MKFYTKQQKPRKKRRYVWVLIGASVAAGVTFILGQLFVEYTQWPQEVSHADIHLLNTLPLGSVEDVRSALEVIDPYQQLDGYLSIGNESITVQLDEHWEAFELPASSQTTVLPKFDNISDMRIVLDPGHHGGAWSETEKRHFTVDGGSPVREGNLNYAVARILQNMLEEAGAEVLLTRGAPPMHPFDPHAQPFDPGREALFWLQQKGEIGAGRDWLQRAREGFLRWGLERKIQQVVQDNPHFLFTRFDLRRRAELASQHGADLLLSIHHNTCFARNTNGVLVFVPGNTLPGELNTPTERFYAVRRVLDGTLQPSIDIARAISVALQEELNVPPLRKEPMAGGDVPLKAAIDDRAAVFARNLAILKRTAVPAVLVEGPCMTNPREYKRLLREDGVIDHVPYSKRAVQYATAVFHALQRHPHFIPNRRSMLSRKPEIH